MWSTECRLLAFLGIITPFVLHYFLNFSVLSVILLWLIFVTSVLVLKTANKGKQTIKKPTVSHLSKRAKRDSNSSNSPLSGRGSGGHVKNDGMKRFPSVKHAVISPIISPICPFQRRPMKEAEYVQRDGYNGIKSKDAAYSPVIYSQSPDMPDCHQDRLAPQPSRLFGHPDKNSSRNVFSASLVRSPLSSVRSPLISPSKNAIIK